MKAAIVGLFALVASATALYSSKSPVIQLTASDFNKKVVKGDGVWLVEFYAPWCGHCKNLAPEWESAAKALSGVVNVAAVDATQHESLAQKYQIQGFPTIKVFSGDKRSPTDYQGQRTASAIVDAGLAEARKLVKQRMGGKGSKSSKSSGSGNGGGRRAGASEPGGGKNVVELTDSNFDSLVTGSNDLWLVEFYAPWCGHCKNLAPEWAEAADQLAGEVKLGAVDATQHQALGGRYDVKGYPTIVVFNPKTGDHEPYNGPRTAAGITEYALNKLEEVGKGREVVELTDQAVFDEQCQSGGGAKRICFVAFLPNILDTGATGRNEHIELIKTVAARQRKRPYRFLWTSATQQPAMEEAMRLEFGFPAMVAISTDKNIYAVHTGAWTEKGLNRFAEALTTGRARTAKFDGSVPPVASVAAWDGSDGAEIEEEFSLDDIMGEDL